MSGTAFTDPSAVVLARYRLDGTLDSRLGDAGVVLTRYESFETGSAGVHLDATGKVYMAGDYNDGERDRLVLARYLT